MKILAIESSCDESGLALLECSGTLSSPKVKLLASEVASQIKIHASFGGVVPNLGKREHAKNLPLIFQKLFPKIHVETVGTESRPKFLFSPAVSLRGADTTEQSSVSKSSKIALTKKELRKLLGVDEIAVTMGPGLEPALWVGIAFAKDLGRATGISVRGANHLEGHLFSFLLSEPYPSSPSKKKRGRTKSSGSRMKDVFPAIALVVSGGHTVLLAVESLTKWKHLGETRDDAAGEAYDKVARLLDLPYPGGPNLEKLATEGNPAAVNFPRPMLHDKNFDFSFSGLKTSVLYFMRDKKNNPDLTYTSELSKQKEGASESFGANSNHMSRVVRDVAASFQQAVIDVLTGKTIRAAKETGAKSVILSGGVAANKALREALGKAVRKSGCVYLVPPWEYNTDNAAMMGVAGFLAHLRKKKFPLRANGNLKI